MIQMNIGIFKDWSAFNARERVAYLYGFRQTVSASFALVENRFYFAICTYLLMKVIHFCHKQQPLVTGSNVYLF